LSERADVAVELWRSSLVTKVSTESVGSDHRNLLKLELLIGSLLLKQRDLVHA